MAEKHDGWIAKDKNGDFWYGTFEIEKEDVESHINTEWYKKHKFTIVKVKLVEVK